MTYLYVDRKDAILSLSENRIVIKANGEAAKLPVNQIDKIILKAPALIEASLLAKLYSIGCGILILSGRKGEPTARMACFPHKEVLRRYKQLETLNDEIKMISLALPFIKSKINGQLKTINKITKYKKTNRDIIKARQQIETIFHSVSGANTLDQLRGYEGAASKAYWPAYACLFPKSLNMTGRNRRPPKDPVNALLSLSYTLAHYEAVTAIEILGLDPMIGSIHAPAYGRESLASDLIEPIRPAIDLWVWELFYNHHLRPENFSYKDGTCIIGKSGRGIFYEIWEEKSTNWKRWLRFATRDYLRKLSPNDAPDAFESVYFNKLEL